MARCRIILILLFLGTVLFTARVSVAESQKLTIIFSGDMRGEMENCHCPKDDFGGLPRRSKYISEVRKKGDSGILLLDVGDTLPLLTPDVDKRSVARNASISFKAMQIMGYDIMNIGESDLILGEDFLAQEGEGLSAPFISANIVDKDTGRPFFKPYVIKTMQNGLKVGIIGLLNERYVINSDRLEILPNKEIASKYIPELKSKSDIVIVLGHLGLPYSINLAESIKGIDVILSGHWDTSTQKPIRIGNTLVMPTSYHSRKIGRLDLDIYGGKVYSYKWESTPLDKEYDGDEAMERFVTVASDNSNSMPADKLGPVQIESLISDRPLRILVFFSAGCRACMEIKRDLLPDIRQKYGDAIVIKHYDIGLPQNYEQMTRLESLYGVGGGYVPEVIVSKYVLMGKEEITSRLDEVIHDALEEPVDLKKNQNLISQAAEYHPPAKSLILSKFESFSMYTVMTAGLLDGVNPCAFSTIVFFISFLAFVGYRKREMIFAGISFTLAVFITYLLIGMGIFRFLRALKVFDYVTLLINTLIAGLAFLLGALCLLDYFRFRKTKDAKSIILKLPQFLKNKIRSMIGSDFRIDPKARKKTFLKIIWVAFSVGFIVSILESFCTGQVYLPTIAFVLKMPGKNMPAFLYLILYNLAFIVPLVAVFLLGLFGVTSRGFSKFMESRMGAVKLSTAALFFLLGTLLIIFR